MPSDGQWLVLMPTWHQDGHVAIVLIVEVVLDRDALFFVQWVYVHVENVVDEILQRIVQLLVGCRGETPKVLGADAGEIGVLDRFLDVILPIVAIYIRLRFH